MLKDIEKAQGFWASFKSRPRQTVLFALAAITVLLVGVLANGYFSEVGRRWAESGSSEKQSLAVIPPRSALTTEEADDSPPAESNETRFNAAQASDGAVEGGQVAASPKGLPTKGESKGSRELHGQPKPTPAATLDAEPPREPIAGPSLTRADAHYEFYFQPVRDGAAHAQEKAKLYEFGFKNITAQPLHNFAFTVHFREPVVSVSYVFAKSSSNFTGGSGLSDDGKKFNWLGNQISEDGGWVVFNVESTGEPKIQQLSTRFTGIAVSGNRIIPPDPDGLR